MSAETPIPDDPRVWALITSARELEACIDRRGKYSGFSVALWGKSVEKHRTRVRLALNAFPGWGSIQEDGTYK